uniref:Peptidase S1 domain-containing protein n=1 Tax=Ditylenchus dipsaci TaxID=166011 RepID=A0A915CY70_9BILA
MQQISWTFKLDQEANGRRKSRYTKWCPRSYSGVTNTISGPQNRIIGAQSALPGQFPHAAFITYASGQGTYCGASIITHRHLLTAKFCFTNLPHTIRNTKGLVLKIGGICHTHEIGVCNKVDMLKVDIDFVIFDTVIRNILHGTGDFAIIQLSNSIPKELFENKTVSIACLPEHKDEEIPDKITQAGWGMIENGLGSNILKYVNLRTWDDCYKELDPELDESKHLFCAYFKNWEGNETKVNIGGNVGDIGDGVVAYSQKRKVLVLHGVFLSFRSHIFAVQGLVSILLRIRYLLDDFCYYLDLCSHPNIIGKTSSH